MVMVVMVVMGGDLWEIPQIFYLKHYDTTNGFYTLDCSDFTLIVTKQTVFIVLKRFTIKSIFDIPSPPIIRVSCLAVPHNKGVP